ncbi:MAG: hypothetical protein RLZZ358_1682 [Bacteroidota bacterium]|jgi:hypothetical protein
MEHTTLPDFSLEKNLALEDLKLAGSLFLKETNFF